MSPATLVRRALVLALILSFVLPALPVRAATERTRTLQQTPPTTPPTVPPGPAPLNATLFDSAASLLEPEADHSGPVATLADARSAVVQIEAVGTFVDIYEGVQANAAGFGSGFLIDPSGIAVTNHHVVTGGALFRVYLEGYDEPRNARVLGVSECADLAVIDIQGDGYPYLAWREGPISVGLDVYAAGFPLGDPEFTLTRGIIAKESAEGDTSWASVDSVLQHDAEIEPGNSGGPLLDADGRVVGINYRHTLEEQYFAISRDAALPILEQLRSGFDVDSIGINGEAIVAEDGFSGIWVASVQSGSPADEAGVLPGDILLTIEGVSLGEDGTMATYCDILRSHLPTDVMSLEVLRVETEEVLKGQLNGRPLQRSFSFAEEAAEPNEAPAGAPVPGDAEYVVISDARGILSAEIPAAWSDVQETAWTMVAGEEEEDVGISIYAAPDLDTFADDWAMPGAVLRYSESLAGTMDAHGLLDNIEYVQECRFGGRETLPGGFYTIAYDFWEECGEADSMALIVAMVPQTGEYVARLELYATSEEDFDALDHILDTFVITPPSESTKQKIRQARYSSNISIEAVNTALYSYEFDLVQDPALTFLAPTTWDDIESDEWLIDGEPVGRQLAIAPDLELYHSRWDAPGLDALMTEQVSPDFDPVAGLDTVDYSDTCDYVDRVPHQHTIYGITYSGAYDVWENCGGVDNTLILLIAKSVPLDHAVLLSFVAVDDADMEAFYVLEESFYVETATTAPLIARTKTIEQPIAPRSDFTVLADEEGIFSIAVPASWTDVSNSGWVFDGERVGRSLIAAPDRSAFLESWEAPGVFVGVSDFLGADYTPEDFLDEFEYYSICGYEDRYTFINSVVDGVYDAWSDCNGVVGSSFLIFAAYSTDDPDMLVFLYARLPDAADRPIFDTLLSGLTLGSETPDPVPVEPVSPVEPDTPEQPEEDLFFAEVLVEALNVRSGPGTEYPRVGGLTRGQLLLVVGQADACAWLFMVSDDGQIGWVSGNPNYVSLSAPCSMIPEIEFPPDEPQQPVNQPSPQQSTQQPPQPAQPASNVGCFLFQNQLGPELTITFTRVGGGYAITFKVGSSDVEQCFPPGRYTYTLDAPPPWGSTNGEIDIAAGDRYLFPIRPAP